MPDNFGLEQLRKLIRGNEANTLRAIEHELNDLGEDVRAAVVEYLDKEGINVDGDIRKSIDYEVGREIGSMQVRVFSSSDHGIFVHEGTRPHWPPKDPIERWVKKKLGVSGRRVPSVAFAVRKKIARSGTEGRPFLSTPFYLYSRPIAQRIAQRIIKELRPG